MLNRTVVISIIFGIALIALIGTFKSNYVKTAVGKGDFAALYKASAWAGRTGSFADPNSLGYYPPSGRPILMIFTLLPLRPAAIVWWLMAVGLHLFCLYLLINFLLPVKPTDPWLLISLVYLAMLPWLVSDLAGGNVSPLILASVVISYFLYRRGRLWSSAIILSIGIVVKFLPIFMIFFYAVKRRWKMVFITSACTLIVGILPGMLLVGSHNFFDSWKTWSREALGRRTAKYMIVESSGISYINQSLANVLLHTLSPVSAGHHDKPFYVNIANLSRTTILKIWYTVVLVSGLLWVYLIWPRKDDPPSIEAVHFAAVCLPMIWFSPHVMTYYLTILMPAVALLIWATTNKRDLPMNIMLALYILGYVLVASVYGRAYGNYQAVVLVLAISIALTSSQIRRSAIHSPL
ncbi:MAG: glycosyltransferase family 87 protein [Phycisphaerae bacterium]